MARGLANNSTEMHRRAPFKVKNSHVEAYLPFLTIDATIGNKAFSHDTCNIFPGLSYNKVNNTFLNSLRKNEVEVQVEFTYKVRESARVTCH